MNRDYENLVQILNLLFREILETRKNYKSGTLGDGNGNVNVPGRPDYSYVRYSTNSVRVSEVFNKRVAGADGTPVLIGVLPWSPGLEQVVTVDWESYTVQPWGSGYSGVPPHAASHTYETETTHGGDPVLVYQPALQPLKVTSDGTGLTVSIQPYTYHYSGLPRTFPGGNIDMTTYLPSAGNRVALLVSLSKATGLLSITPGTEIPDTGAPPPPPTFPDNSVPAGVISLSSNQTVISQTDITDVRDFLSGGGTASLPTGEPGQVLYNVDGSMSVVTPVTDGAGWLVDDTGKLIVDM